jgi:hypothetical protein
MPVTPISASATGLGFRDGGVAALVTLDRRGNMERVRVGITRLAAKAFRAKAVENALVGKAPVAGKFPLPQLMLRTTSTRFQTFMRRRISAPHFACVYTRRAIEAAVSRARNNHPSDEGFGAKRILPASRRAGGHDAARGRRLVVRTQVQRLSRARCEGSLPSSAVLAKQQGPHQTIRSATVRIFQSTEVPVKMDFRVRNALVPELKGDFPLTAELADRIRREIEHGAKDVAMRQAEAGWDSPAGRIRRDRRARFLLNQVPRSARGTSAAPLPALDDSAKRMADQRARRPGRSLGAHLSSAGSGARIL